MACGSGITRRDLEGKMVAWEIGRAGRVRSKQRPNKRRCCEAKTSTCITDPGQAPPVGLLASSPGMARARRVLRRGRRGSEERKERGFPAGGRVSSVSRHVVSPSIKTEQTTRACVVVSQNLNPSLPPGARERLRLRRR